VTPSTLTIAAPVPARARNELGSPRHPSPRAQSDGYTGETELSKLIRYGCMFELEVHQMEEQRLMQAENRQLRQDLEETTQTQPSEVKGKLRRRRAIREGSGSII
jgi:hypothetical protein